MLPSATITSMSIGGSRPTGLSAGLTKETLVLQSLEQPLTGWTVTLLRGSTPGRGRLKDFSFFFFSESTAVQTRHFVSPSCARLVLRSVRT